MSIVNYVFIVAVALAGGLPNLEAAFPVSATPWLKGAAAVFALVAGVAGAISGPIVPKSEALKLSSIRPPALPTTHATDPRLTEIK
jgi:hypothetical protein